MLLTWIFFCWKHIYFNKDILLLRVLKSAGLEVNAEKI
jgi:hypothetical protein